MSSSQSNIDLNEKFNIFDNFLTSNKDTLERGDDEWDSSKIFFQLSIEHADNSPLTHGAEKFEEEGKVDWDYFKNINRDDRFVVSPVIHKIVTKSNVIKTINVEQNILLLILDKSNEIILYNYDSGLKNYLTGHNANISDVLFFDNKFLSYDKDNFLILWDENFNKLSEYKLENKIKKVQLLKTKLVIYTANKISFISIDSFDLSILDSNTNQIDNEYEEIVYEYEGGSRFFYETNIFEFENSNFSKIKIGSSAIELIDAKFNILDEQSYERFIGFYNNKLFVLVNSHINIFDQDLKLVDEYEIDDINKFNKDTMILDDNIIITSHDIMYYQGWLAADPDKIDDEMIVWSKGKKEKTLKPHLTGCRVSIFGQNIVTIGSDGYIKFFDFNYNFLNVLKGTEIQHLSNEIFLVDNHDIVDLSKVSANNIGYIDTTGMVMYNVLIYPPKMIVVTCGTKNINIWHKSSSHPINIIDTKGQILDLKKINDYILVQFKKTNCSLEYFHIYDLSGNLLDELFFEYETVHKILKDNLICFAAAKMESISKNIIIYDYQKKEIVSSFYAEYSLHRQLIILNDNFLFINTSKTQIYYEIHNQYGVLISRNSIDCSDYFEDLTESVIYTKGFEKDKRVTAFLVTEEPYEDIEEELNRKTFIFSLDKDGKVININNLDDDVADNLECINNQFVCATYDTIKFLSNDMQIDKIINRYNNYFNCELRRYVPDDWTYKGYSYSMSESCISIYMPQKIAWIGEGYIVGEMNDLMIVNDNGYIRFIEMNQRSQSNLS